MKKSLIVLLVCIGVAITSCSSDDENNANDIIIGKWVPFEFYESNILIEMPYCKPFVYKEYKVDKRLSGGMVSDTIIPDECLVVFDGGWHWENKGNNQYRIWHDSGEESSSTFYINQGNLFEEYPNGTTKIIYKTYQ